MDAMCCVYLFEQVFRPAKVKMHSRLICHQYVLELLF